MFLKKVLGIYLIKYFWAKNSVLAIFFKPKNAWNCRFRAVFVYFGQQGGLFASFNSLHHHPLAGYPIRQ
jgi:hypothetical protein